TAQYRTLWKARDGKTRSLLVLGGYESFGPRGLRTTPLADALPVVFAVGQSQSEKPFRLRLTARGEAHPLFTLSGDRALSLKQWAEAPPLEGVPLVQRAKPGADGL